MKRRDIEYLNSWGKCFEPASPAIVMKALIEGIWISSNRDPEDIYRVYPELIITAVGSSAEIDKQYNMCPFEFSIRDGETYEEDIGIFAKAGDEIKKGRTIHSFGTTWQLDKYEMRKAVTRDGLEIAKKYKITEEEIKALHSKYEWDDKAMYNELVANRRDLWMIFQKKDFCNLSYSEFQFVRAAFCPHFDPLYTWMDDPKKAGFESIDE